MCEEKCTFRRFPECRQDFRILAALAYTGRHRRDEKSRKRGKEASGKGTPDSRNTRSRALSCRYFTAARASVAASISSSLPAARREENERE